VCVCVVSVTEREGERERERVGVLLVVFFRVPIPVVARSEAWVCDNLLDEIASSNPAVSLSLSCESLWVVR
jgi:hypothetical protein